MARTARNTKLDTRTARSRLKEQKSAYWTSLTPGHALGYRKGRKGGVWIAKLVLDGTRKEETLGTADDMLDPDGETVLSFAQAQAKARQWFDATKRTEHGINVSDLTVEDAMREYLTAYGKEGKSEKATKCAIDAFILPKLGKERVQKLSHRRIESWHQEIATSAPRLRTKKGREQKFKDIADDPEGVRRRRSTANRILTILKAALNRAATEYRGLSDDAWRRVKPYKGVDASKARYLTDDEVRRLVNASEEPFRTLVVAGMMTGCRYGELAALLAVDFNADVGTVFIRESKAGKSRHVYLTDEGKAFFVRAATGKGGADLLLPRKGKTAWGKSHQGRPMTEACDQAKIDPPIGFHILRHTYASRLVMQGADLIVVARQLGHADTRMVEKHYGHLAPGYVANAVREAFSDMGLTKADNVVTLSEAKKAQK
jgi:integrase